MWQQDATVHNSNTYIKRFAKYELEMNTKITQPNIWLLAWYAAIQVGDSNIDYSELCRSHWSLLKHGVGYLLVRAGNSCLIAWIQTSNMVKMSASRNCLGLRRKKKKKWKIYTRLKKLVMQLVNFWHKELISPCAGLFLFYALSHGKIFVHSELYLSSKKVDVHSPFPCNIGVKICFALCSSQSDLRFRLKVT